MSISVESLTSELVLRWKIENFSLRKGRLESPHFYYDLADWRVEILLKYLCLGGDQITIGFHQLTDRKIQANWSCAFLNSKGSLLNLSEKSEYNTGESCNTCSWIINYNDIFNASNLPNDTLTVVCRIWKDDKRFYRLQMTKSELMPFLPRSDFEQFRVVTGRNFLWKIDLSILKPGEIVNLMRPMLRDLNLTIQVYKENIQRLIVILEVPPCTVLAKYKIYLLSTRKNAKPVEFKEDQFKTDNSRYFCYLNLRLYEMPQVAQFLFSYAYYDNRIEEIFVNNSIRNVLPNRIPDTSTNSSESVSEQPKPITHKPLSRQPPQTDSPNTVSHDLRSMYEEGILSDFSLRVQDKTFPVHKSILGARSSVFRAMFTADMKEKQSGHVNIPDLDADTIQRMLKFVYWDHVDMNLHWDSVCSLYSAANKYALESLKQRCSSYLRVNLSAASVLGVLLLSDTHQDKVLKAAAVDFISKNDKEIIGTEQWNKFKEEHGPFSLEILQQLYLKKMAG